jgi:hypothetical protein
MEQFSRELLIGGATLDRSTKEGACCPLKMGFVVAMLRARTKTRPSLSEFQIWALGLLLFSVGLDTRFLLHQPKKKPRNTTLGASSLRQNSKEESDESEDTG